jgi:hypothetical protein
MTPRGTVADWRRRTLTWPLLWLAASSALAQQQHADPDMNSSGRLGDYPMMRDASGTAWQPDGALMAGAHGQLGSWSTMLHGYLYAVDDHQGGPRGAQASFSESMLMATAQRRLGASRLSLKAMLSLDPLMGKSGYPLLLQTGESADGVTPLIDRQHPHDLFMELAVTASTPWSERVSAFVYAGYPGEPALGPPAFMHRYSAAANPEAPISHHWLDSTHTSYGVFTGGVVVGNWKAEASAFNGREPDQFRWNFDPLRIDSWSGRLSWNPLASLALQLSYGSIHAPEALEPAVDIRRLTVSAIVDRPLPTAHLQLTMAWGQNRASPGQTSNAWLLESMLGHARHHYFARAEGAGKNELIVSGPQVGQLYNVAKLSVGYLYEFLLARRLNLGCGAMISGYALPTALQAQYGPHPNSYLLFMRLGLQ